MTLRTSNAFSINHLYKGEEQVEEEMDFMACDCKFNQINSNEYCTEYYSIGHRNNLGICFHCFMYLDEKHGYEKFSLLDPSAVACFLDL